ncbi:MAG: ribonucleoside-diphosphate reductase subunit alpha [Patescibacteria group bacterium]
MKWLNENSRKFLAKDYINDGSTAEERIRFLAEHAQKILGIDGFADKFYGYMEKGYFSLSTPVWVNFGFSKGLPISCFGSYVGDTMGDILYTTAEVGMMSKKGGGTSAYFGDLRERGAAITNNGTSSGPVHFMRLFDTVTNVVSQGSTRRGHLAAYLPVEHPDIDEFLNVGTEGDPIQGLTHAVTVTDEWMKSMQEGDEAKRNVWAKVIKRRTEIGYPYILFTDNVNNNTVEVYKDKHKIYASNLCSEIALPSDDKWSFVCCLSSMNVLYYDEWKNTDAVQTLTYFLDAVMTDFITKLEGYRDSEDAERRQEFFFMEKSYRFAVENRAIGVGALGWHSFLQSKMIAFESQKAAILNVEVFKFIKDKAYEASAEMAVKYGEPAMLKGIGRRHTTLCAVAPTTSSAFILGQVSQSIEPVWSNCYVKDIEKMKVTITNPFLEKLLEEKGKNTKEVWQDIRDKDGSVQHVDFLTEEEKDVFKTFAEIDQYAIIDQAGARQMFIDQSQSLNLMINPKTTSAKEINALYIDAWKNGVKTLYYQHSMNAAQVLGRKKVCISCES